MSFARKWIIAGLVAAASLTVGACKTLQGSGNKLASPAESGSNPNTPPPPATISEPSGANLHGSGESADYAGTDSTGTRNSHADEAGFRGAGTSGRELLP